MNKILSKTLLSYRSALFVDDYRKSASTEKHSDLIFAIAADFSQLGYVPSKELISVLKTFSEHSLKEFHADSISLLKQVVGADVKYAPLFRKFPDEIPNRDLILVTLFDSYGWFSHILHYEIYSYWSPTDYNGNWFGRQFPGITLEEAFARPELVSTKPLKVLGVATVDATQEVFRNLVGAKGSISDTDKAFVKEFISEFDIFNQYTLPNEIPNKENLTFTIGAVSARYGMIENVREMFLPYMKTATDILRTAAAFSGSDVALVEHSRFKLSNSQRKFVLAALDDLSYESATEDMLRFHALWLVLAKYLHVNAYADKYPHATKMVQAIRGNSKKISTFNRKVEYMLMAADLNNATQLDDLLKVLSARPGDFARRLDHVLRLTNKKTVVADAFLAVADKVASPLLLNLSSHIWHRDTPANVRVYCPKGSTTNATVVRGDERDLLPTNITNYISNGIASILTARYSEKESLGRVYIDPALRDILLPTSMRDASDSLQVVARGSKFRIANDAKVVRMFLYWEDIKEDAGYNNRVDVDLSLMVLGDNFRELGTVSYYNLRGDGSSIVHSGDFTSAPNGAAEFIDVNIDAALHAYKGARYIAVTVNSYTGQSFDKFTAKAGYMIRDGKTGKSFEAKAVEQKYDITAGTKFAVPMVLDLKERKVIWLDLGLVDSNKMFTNIGKKGADLTSLAQYAVEMQREKASMFDLLELHALGRGTSLSTVDPDGEYDTVFDMSMITRVDEIMSKWL